MCSGTLLSRAQYLIDIEHWGYRDARLVPPAVMTDAQVDRWTAAIEETADLKARQRAADVAAHGEAEHGLADRNRCRHRAACAA